MTKGKKEKLLQMLKLIERLPVRAYAAPGAEEDLARRLGEKFSKEAISHFVRHGISVRSPDEMPYLYGQGILLETSDRNKLIDLLRSLAFGKVGHPKVSKDEKVRAAEKDAQLFKKVLAEIEGKEGKRGAKTRAYKVLQEKWNLTFDGVRNRVKTALERSPEDELPF
jgi:hypothetical protein